VTLPCRYGDMKGTSWYDRLIASEFDIRLDHYPHRETLKDRELPASARSGPLWEQYREILLSLKFDPRKDEMTPMDFIVRFREARSRLFPELLKGKRQAAPLSPRDLQVPQPGPEGWEGFKAALNGTGRTLYSDPGEELRGLLENRRKVLFIPSGRQPALTEALRYLSPWGDRELEMAVSCNAALDLPAAEDLTGLPFAVTPRTVSSLDDLTGLTGPDRCILCSHPWILFSLLEKTEDFGILVDDREWFVRSCLGTSRTTGERVSHPSESGYGRLLTPMGPPSKGSLFASHASRFPRPAGRSPAEPACKSQAGLPGWITAGKSSGGPGFSEGFMIRNGGEWQRIDGPRPGAVHAAVLSLPEDSVILNPLFPDRMTSPLSVPSEDPLYLTCFNYYFTENLRFLYEKEAGGLGEWNSFLLDYLGVFGGAGDTGKEDWETLPLYPKAFLGYSREGRLYGFHTEASRISWTAPDGIERETVINPEDDCLEALYLPGPGDRMVGEGRTCALICQDTVMEVLPGPVRVPPFGAVLATDVPLDAGSVLKWRVEWKDAPLPKDEWRWLFGGFNLLIREGENLYARPDGGEETLLREGWRNPLSVKTQETQLVAGVRQPRSVLGRTRSGRIFLAVISGRSRLSAGATFEESAALAETLTREDPLEFLINLDGGASAALTAVKGDSRAVLSYPAPSESNPPGIPRPVPAMLTIKEIR